MKLKKTFLIIVTTLLLCLSACGAAGIPVNGGTDSGPAEATAALQTQVAIIVASTQAAQTEAAGIAASTIGAQTEIAKAVASTLTALVTSTPEFTFTSSFTSTASLSPTPTPTITPTFTLTPNYPRVSVSVNTNCRSGPGAAYEILGLFRAGETAEIVGQDFDRGNWVIRLPSNPAIICWVWRNSATVTGNTSPVPIFTPQPTPTEAIDFKLTYDSFTSCSGVYYVKFKIVNNSNLTWESNQVNVTDRTTNVTTTINRNYFSNYNGCTLGSNDSNLEPGEIGITTSSGFAANLSGHDFKATIQVCSADGQGGTCVVKTINFVP
jgi:uncharacterized protein YgiM (DUF1202 family)